VLLRVDSWIVSALANNDELNLQFLTLRCVRQSAVRRHT
jgi:hypothetical protein